MQVTGLYVYPLKAARGRPLDVAVLDELGLAGDRRWCVVDPEGRVVTQRECPALATIEVDLTADGIVLRRDGLEPLAVETPSPEESRVSVRVHDDRTEGVAAAAGTDDWLAAALGRSLRLVHMPSTVRREVSQAYGRPGDRVGFADGFPLLLTSEASLEEVNRRLDAPVPMDRFRPNVVVDAGQPFEEDEWKRIRIGAAEFRVVKPCGRCVVITTDQRTGARGPEPLHTLATFRKAGGKVLFGQNLIHDGRGPIRAGDRVEVLERQA
jgi:uncharacterized protein YcbX